MQFFTINRGGITMLNKQDFSKKQVVFILFNEGEKIAFQNDNLIIKSGDGKTKFQCTCYRLFIVYAIGNCSVTSVLLQKARKYGFFIVMMTTGFRIYAIIGAEKDGNTLLKQKQYQYDKLDIAKHITRNKLHNQCFVLKQVRDKSDSVKEAIANIEKYITYIDGISDLRELMAYEGLSSKVYFRNHFNNILWNGRKPRIKHDYVNSTLDIGYSLLFTYVESILASFGFDTFCGVMHRQFYMRKSLVCDLVEPFRPLIDVQIKKGINLKQIKEEDFLVIDHQFRLKWENSTKYVKLLMTPLIEHKDEVFGYIQMYYRAFMKEAHINRYPVFYIGGNNI